MEKVETLKRLVEYAESGGLTHPVDVLEGIEHDELIDLSKTFENLAAFTRGAATKQSSAAADMNMVLGRQVRLFGRRGVSTIRGKRRQSPSLSLDAIGARDVFW